MQYHHIYKIGVRSKTSNGNYGSIVLGVRNPHHPRGILGMMPVIRKIRAFMDGMVVVVWRDGDGQS